MAGLLDIFGTGGSDTMSLLGMSPTDIQRNRDDAQAQALYALAGRLFQGGNTGASIAQGLQQGQQAYKGAMQGNLQELLQNTQLQEMLKKRKEEELTKQQQLQAQQILAKAYRPETFAETPLTNLMGEQIAGPNQPQAAGGGLKSVTRELMGLGPAGMSALQAASSVEKALRPEGYTLGEGQIRYEIGPDGKPMQVAAGAPKEKPLHYQDIGNAVVAFDSTGKEVSRITKGRPPEGPINFQTIETDQGLMAFNPRTLQMTPVLDAKGNPITKAGKPTEAETNAAGFASRMVAANAITSKLASGNVPKTVEAISSVIPLIGKAIPEIIPEGIGGLSPERRQYLQAANNFIRANLRKESGAAIGADEWTAEFVNYFPQYNDDPQTIKQKEIFRNILTQNMIASGGKSYKAPSLEMPESMTDAYGLNPRLRDSLRGGR